MNLSSEQVRRFRLAGQYLDHAAAKHNLAAVVRSVVGVNAQQTAAMRLSLRARIRGLEVSDIEDSVRQKTLVRTWAMRGTIHLLDGGDVRWMVSLLGPGFFRKDQSRRLELGLTDEIFTAALQAIPEIMADGSPLPREALMDRLIEKGIAISKQGQAPAHVVQSAAMKGILVLGPDAENGKSTYVLLDRWVPEDNQITQSEALTRLAERYLEGYGPVDLKDFTDWSGLPAGLARQGWEAAAAKSSWVKAGYETRELWVSKDRIKSVGTGLTVRLLPAFDSYLLGYSNRDLVVPPQYQKQVYHGGQVVPVVLLDGIAAGTWRYEAQGKTLIISVQPFTSFSSEIKELISFEAEDISRFMGRKLKLSLG